METKKGEESYTYVFQLCGDAGGVQGAGVVQVDNKKTENKQTVIGMYNSTQAIGGSKSAKYKNVTLIYPDSVLIDLQHVNINHLWCGTLGWRIV